MTDYKQLCADLVAWAEKTSAHYYSEPGVLIQARAALAEPEPEGPTDEELLDTANAEMSNSPNWADQEYDPSNVFPYEAPPCAWINFARAVLARWGNHPGSPDSSAQPS